MPNKCPKNVRKLSDKCPEPLRRQVLDKFCLVGQCFYLVTLSNVCPLTKASSPESLCLCCSALLNGRRKEGLLTEKDVTATLLIVALPTHVFEAASSSRNSTAPITETRCVSKSFTALITSCTLLPALVNYNQHPLPRQLIITSIYAALSAPGTGAQTQNEHQCSWNSPSDLYLQNTWL